MDWTPIVQEIVRWVVPTGASGWLALRAWGSYVRKQEILAYLRQGAAFLEQLDLWVTERMKSIDLSYPPPPDGTPDDLEDPLAKARIAEARGVIQDARAFASELTRHIARWDGVGGPENYARMVKMTAPYIERFEHIKASFPRASLSASGRCAPVPWFKWARVSEQEVKDATGPPRT